MIGRDEQRIRDDRKGIIRRAMHERGLRQADLAAALGVTQQRLSKLLTHGEPDALSEDQFRRLIPTIGKMAALLYLGAPYDITRDDVTIVEQKGRRVVAAPGDALVKETEALHTRTQVAAAKARALADGRVDAVERQEIQQLTRTAYEREAEADAVFDQLAGAPFAGGSPSPVNAR